MVPFATVAGRLPRAVVVEHTTKLYQAFTVEEILDELEIKWRNPKDAPGSWLPIEGFDSEDFETRSPEEWVDIIRQAGNKPLKALALCKDPNNEETCAWCPVKVVGYDPERELYKIEFVNPPSIGGFIHRVKLFIYSEDPRVFANRYASAYYRRSYADSLIRYNYYIENMPTDEIPELSNEQITKMITQAMTARSFRGKSRLDTQSLINEVNTDFAKIMNKIIFDRHIASTGKEIIGGTLMLPPPESKKSRYYGMIDTADHDFKRIKNKFALESFITRKEAVKVGERINLECLEVSEKEVFNTNFNKTLKLDEFKQIEASSISQCSYYLRETWVTKIKDIIKDNFRNSKEWFNLSERDLDTYNRSKLKRFLTFVRLKMQGKILSLFEKSFKKYVNTLLRFIPKNCVVISTNSVRNEYDDIQFDELGKPPFPLFSIELMAVGKPEEMPSFSQDPHKLAEVASWLFDRAAEDLQQISQVEPKVMPEFFKTLLRVDLRVPFRPQKRLQNLNKAEASTAFKLDKKEMEDNKWMDEYYEKLKEGLLKSVKPLEEYKAFFSKYKAEFLLDVEEEKRLMDDQENPMSSQELKKCISKHEEIERRLRNEIPERIQISIYQVDCKNLINKLAEKHTELIQEAKHILKRRAVKYVETITEELENVKIKIKKVPNTIEELTSLRNYIVNELPGVIERQKHEIEKMEETYDILAEYQKQLSYEEFNKKWTAFRMPKELLSIVEDQKPILNKKEETLYAIMQHHQVEFKEDIYKIEDVINSLKNFIDIKEYEEMAKKTLEIREKLKEYKEKERNFNHAESLLNKSTTDYGQLKLIEKDFIPYDNLWSTTEKWFSSKHSWHNDEWKKLDAQAMENLVNDSGRILSQTIRAFREMPAILKIAEQVKDEVEKFRRYVPLALALRTEGMKDRHWNEITSVVGFEVYPKESFTMTTVINMNLIDYLAEIEKVSEKAAKEYAIEMNLLNMKKSWEKVDFKLFAWKTSGTWIVAQISFEDINALIDENMVLTQQMMSSRKYLLTC